MYGATYEARAWSAERQPGSNTISPGTRSSRPGGIPRCARECRVVRALLGATIIPFMQFLPLKRTAATLGSRIQKGRLH